MNVLTRDDPKAKRKASAVPNAKIKHSPEKPLSELTYKQRLALANKGRAKDEKLKLDHFPPLRMVEIGVKIPFIPAIKGKRR